MQHYGHVIHTHGARGQVEEPEEPDSSGWERVLSTAQDWTPGGPAETLFFTAAMAGTAVGLLVGAILEHAVLGAVVGCLAGAAGWPLLGVTAYRRVRARERRAARGDGADRRAEPRAGGEAGTGHRPHSRRRHVA